MKTLGKAVIGLSKYLGVSPFTAAIKELAQTISGAWTFTSALTISRTVSGTAINLTSTDAGAATGPNIFARRDSATPAANDFLSAWQINGNDSGGNSTDYALIFGQIIDPTNGSEDSRVGFRTLNAGSSYDWYLQSGGWFAQAATGGAQGTGTINATGLYINGVALTPVNLQTPVIDTSTTYTSTANVMNYDNSIPQNTEGAEILSAAITPTDAASILVITVNLPMVANSAATFTSAALFVDSTANALAASGVDTDGPGVTTSISFIYRVVAGSTTARTYKVRFGPDSGTAFLNGNSTSRIFGGVASATLMIQEFAP